MIADRILIPVTPSQADIWSTQRFVQFLYKNTHGNPPDAITFLNRADTNKTIRASDEAAAALNALPGIRLMTQRLSDRIVFRDSFSEGLAVFALEPRTVASREFRAFAEALFGRAQRTMLDRLRKQKTSTAVDASLREALETPSAVFGGMSDRLGHEDLASGSAPRSPQGGWDSDQLGRKKRKGKDGKKRKKAEKARQAGKGKKGKKGKKAKKGKKGK